MKRIMMKSYCARFAIVAIAALSPCIVLGAHIVSAQGEVFKILAGKNAFVGALGAQNSWRSARAGGVVLANSLFKVERGGYAALLHASGKALEINESGTYTVADLEKRLNKAAAQTTLASKAAQFLVNAVSKDGDGAGVHQKNMNNLGAVARMSTGGDFRIQALMPRSALLTDSVADFVWFSYNNASAGGISLGASRAKSPRPATTYEIRITETAGGRFVLSRRLADTVLRLNRSENGFALGVSYSWSVGVTNASASFSEPSAFAWATTERVAAIADTAAAVRAQCADGESAIAWLALARLYERNGAVPQAIAAYRSALEKSPDIPEYRELYAAFLLSIGLTEEDAACLPPPSK